MNDLTVQSRKAQHLTLALDRRVEGGVGSGLADVDLVHEALPEIDLDEVDLSTELFGRRLRAPLVIAGMTGGDATTHEINARLARAAERHGIAMGVGSQRAGLRDPAVAYTYEVVRAEAPTATVFGNIGAAQLVPQADGVPLLADDVRAACEMVSADAIAIHLNSLEELIQPEGDRRMRGWADAIAVMVNELDVPVIAKETGAGMTRDTATRLCELGVSALDVGGAGGTNFAMIEQMRAEDQGDTRGTQLGLTLSRWGIPTAVSVVGAAVTPVPVIATGGIRTGLDAAKALALGATLIGIGRPLLAAAAEGERALESKLNDLLEELRVALVLTGCQQPGDLRKRAVVIGGRTRAWLDALGYDMPVRGA